MNISPSIAQQIVESMKSIINQDINFINTNGTIIASTDKSRIGTFHEAGKYVADNKQPIIIDANDHWQGSRPGINQPVTINDELVAVIGITGKPQEVTTYGSIIRKMTEILILQEDFQFMCQREQECDRMLLEDLIFYPDDFADRWDEATLSNWRSNEDYKRIIIIKLSQPTDYFFQEARSTLTRQTLAQPRIFRNRLLFMEREQNLVILYKESIAKNLAYCLDLIKQQALKQDNQLYIAYGSQVHRDFTLSYKDAQLALKFASKQVLSPTDTKGNTTIHYDNLTIELLLAKENQHRQETLCKKVLGKLTNKELDEFYTIILQFEKYNGSIAHVSEKLFIHKNTLQYKIQKLLRLTGYDMRQYHDFMILRLAFTIANELGR